MPVRRVNAPYNVSANEAAILWFGRVTPTENSVDVRIRYLDDELVVRVDAFDRRLWYDTSPSPDDLNAWDAVTLYLNTNGNTSNAPDATAYRFDAQLVWWEERDDYQAAYQGNGSDWVPSAMAFSTVSGWRGDEPNNSVDDRGWGLAFHIPFASLGLDTPPPQTTVWGLALAVHDRDDAEGTPIPDQVWPEAMQPQQPATWGQLSFGIPTFAPPPVTSEETTVIRQGLDGAIVTDGAVGGGTTCGGGLDYWSEWGETNYSGSEYFNIQNQGDVADWPCFSKYYVTFPLDALPADAAIRSAKLTLYLFGSAGAGWEPGPQPSLIQVLTISDEWDENTLAWNNAPLATENVSAAWVEPVDSFPGWPGIPWEWDVSSAVAQAHAAEGPLRLALYEADLAYHSGKYFVSSDTGDWNAVARPTLTITWGYTAAQLSKIAVPTAASQGDSVAYTLDFSGTGNLLTLTDTLPAGLGIPINFELEGTTITPIYDSDEHHLTWNDTPPPGQVVTIRYVASITASSQQLLVNTAQLVEVNGSSTTTAIVIANPHQFYLPILFK